MLQRVRDVVEAAMDRAGLQPVSLAVFAGSGLLLLGLQAGSCGGVRAPAVATAPSVEQPAAAASFVEAVHVRPGDRVEVGTPLVTLSARFLEREAALLDAEILQAEREARLEQVRLAEDQRMLELEVSDRMGRARVDAARARALQESRTAVLAFLEKQVEDVQRRGQDRLVREDEVRETALLLHERKASTSEASEVAHSEIDRLRQLEATIRRRPDLPLLAGMTSDVFDARLEVLRRRREAVAEDLRRLTVTASVPGRVASVAAAGLAVPVGGSVATVLPESATEILAYAPARTDPAAIVPGQELALASAPGGCAGKVTVLRRGAAVEQAPAGVLPPLRGALLGLPVYTSIPPGCRLGIGQVLALDLPGAAR